jgi:TRAP-type C4-dicarboxylate transport system permease small subunit
MFTDHMSVRAKAIMETFGIVLGFVIFGIVAAAGYTHFAEGWEVGSYNDGVLDLPEWPARFVVFLGIAVFAVRLALDSVLAILGIARGTAVTIARSEADHILERDG